jgi:mannose/fructose/N-acetylgalactosamine-specific phosphotransferase system component IIB
MISLIRIDDRLIHAQVVIGWYEECNPDRIILADDQVAESEMEKKLYASAVTPEIKVSIISLQEAADRINNGVYHSETVLLLVRSPVEALKLYRCGLLFDEINVGGMHFNTNREKVLEGVYVSEEEKAAFRELVKRKVTLEVRALPEDQKVILNSRIV